jgi:hypothetical protein
MKLIELCIPVDAFQNRAPAVGSPSAAEPPDAKQEIAPAHKEEQTSKEKGTLP